MRSHGKRNCLEPSYPDVIRRVQDTDHELRNEVTMTAPECLYLTHISARGGCLLLHRLLQRGRERRMLSSVHDSPKVSSFQQSGRER